MRQFIITEVSPKQAYKLLVLFNGGVHTSVVRLNWEQVVKELERIKKAEELND